METNNNPIKKKKTLSNNAFMHYAGLGFQMMATAVVGVLLGMWLDKYFQTPKPYLTALCTVLFVVLAVYQAIRGLLK